MADKPPRKAPRPAVSDDNKERQLCFAHEGARLDQSKFDGLHFETATGTTLDDGTQYTSITLRRGHGRRVAHLPNIIADYNKLVETAIRPEPVPSSKSAIIHGAASNAILARIQSDCSVKAAAFWSWPSKREEERTCKRAGVVLVDLVRELGLNPKKVNMQSAEDEINRRYLNERGKGPDFNGRFDEGDKAFLLGELRRCFASELSFAVAPSKYAKDALPAAAVLGLDGWMGDCLPDGVGPIPQRPASPTYAFGAASSERRKQIVVTGAIKKPHRVIVEYLQGMLVQWEGQDVVTLDAKDVTFALNRNQPTGVYKTVDSCSFMRPFIQNGCVELFRVLNFDYQYYQLVINVQKVEAFLGEIV